MFCFCVKCSLCICFSHFYVCIVQRKQACPAWKSAIEIKSLLLSLMFTGSVAVVCFAGDSKHLPIQFRHRKALVFRWRCQRWVLWVVVVTAVVVVVRGREGVAVAVEQVHMAMIQCMNHVKHSFAMW